MMMNMTQKSTPIAMLEIVQIHAILNLLLEWV